MEVTKSNFQELLPVVTEAIQQSDFVAIDCELTGLNTIQDINAFDTQPQYYEKVRRSSKDFLVIQYGICTFRYVKTSRVFKQQAFNFYIFPRPINRKFPDQRFLCQASSIDFLITQGFDFNKLFKEGISYLNSVKEEKYRKVLSEQQKARANLLQNSFTSKDDKSNYIAMSVEEKSVVDDIFKKIEEFMSGTEKEMDLPRCNAYIRRLVYQEAPTRLKNKVSLETRTLENKDRILVVTRSKTKNEKEAEERKKVEDEEQELENCIGFSKVIKTIVNSEKLVVGHNLCLDFLHTLDKFLTPLPEDYQEFKDLANSLFPNLLDTKYMCSAMPFKEFINSSVLPHLLKSITEKPFKVPNIEIEEGGKGYQLENNKQHEAGYDAFITGLSFLAMWNYLGNPNDSEDRQDPFTDFSLLEPYKNRIFLMRLHDSPCIHFGAADLIPPRDNVLHITFPKEWKLNDIIQLFSPFGNVYVAWIDERSAYVGLQKYDQTAIALSTLSQSDTYRVVSYAKRQAQLAGRSTIISQPPLPSFKREKSSVGLNTTIKKRRTFSLGESSGPKKRNIEAMEEHPKGFLQAAMTQAEVKINLHNFDVKKSPKKSFNVKKTFEEDNAWE